MYFRQVSQLEVDDYRDRVRAEFGHLPFAINSNGAGVRVECLVCHSSNTQTPEMFMHNHTHEAR